MHHGKLRPAQARDGDRIEENRVGLGPQRLDRDPHGLEARRDARIAGADMIPTTESPMIPEPTRPPFALVANHASHLDAIILGGILPLRFVGAVFPIAAGDTFFTKRASSIFATAFMNALPIWRKSCGAHSLEDLRERLLKGSSVYILFPEGTRTRTGAMASFKPGLGRLVAGTSVPIVPCYLNGTFAALPASGTVPRWKKISVTIGKPLSFSATTNDRAGWELIAAATENALRALA